MRGQKCEYKFHDFFDTDYISKEDRDADPLSCDGQRFTSSGKLENWFNLNTSLLR
jgi:hypothetical protein